MLFRRRTVRASWHFEDKKARLMAITTIHIAELDCNAEAQVLRKTVGSMLGVGGEINDGGPLRFDFVNRRMVVTHDPDRVNAAALLAKVRAVGMTPTLVDADNGVRGTDTLGVLTNDLADSGTAGADEAPPWWLRHGPFILSGLFAVGAEAAYFAGIIGEQVGGIGAMGHRHAPEMEVMATRPSVVSRRDGRLCTAVRTLLTRTCYWIPTRRRSGVARGATIVCPQLRFCMTVSSYRRCQRAGCTRLYLQYASGCRPSTLLASEWREAPAKTREADGRPQPVWFKSF